MTVPQTEPVLIDVSSNNGAWNETMAQGKIQGAFLRMLLGENLDSKFWEYRSDIGNIENVVWTPYFFWVADIKLTHIINKIKINACTLVNGAYRFDGQFGLWVDLEKGSKPIWMSKLVFTNNLEKLINGIYDELGILIGVYTRKTWYDPNTYQNDFIKGKNLAGEPVKLWVSHPEEPNPWIPREWENADLTYEIHQREWAQNVGPLYGFDSDDLDLNNYHYGLPRFNQEYGLNVKPLNLTPPPSLPEKVIVTSNVVRIRNVPSAISDSSIIGETTLGKVWYPDYQAFDELGRTWYQFGDMKKINIAAWLTKPL